MAAPNGYFTGSIHNADKADWRQKLTLTGFGTGLLSIVISGFSASGQRLFMFAGIGLAAVSLIIYFLQTYLTSQPGVRNNGIWLRPATARGHIAWITAVILTGFYVVLYWWPDLFNGLIRSLDPVSQALRGKAADQWFLYGTFYTLAVLIMGGRALLKYRHSRYQFIRTLSVIFFSWFLPT